MTNKKLYFLGIGGIGMSALAQYFLAEGDEVYGYDLTPSPITDMLTQKGAVIHFDDNPDKIPHDIGFAVYTPAVPRTNAEFQYFTENNIPLYKRSQVLGHITEQLPAVAVAGTHGKTTTTSMVAHLLAPEVSIAGFIGGIAKNFHDNLVLGANPAAAVAEADEYDRSFLTLHPTVAIITSMDADHLDIYGTRDNLVAAFQQYATQSKTVLVEESIADQIEHPHKLIYGIGKNTDYQAENIHLAPNCATFDLRTPDGVMPQLQLRANGLYNVLNATAAVAALLVLFKSEHPAVKPATPILIADKLRTFAGVKRRFDYIVDREDFIYIDDYAHHPEEMHSFISAVRKIYPEKQICGIFQPHLYSRTRDFAKQFAEVLSQLDEVILLPIY
ncbi:MAG: UDP-N-acetylmuramate--L-alanine ligase, partial [Bacteroidales bacterium]|nr:UDP-N-acetylmuramate--L-alanine ligase [Bacteroidales bacterium]